MALDRLLVDVDPLAGAGDGHLLLRGARLLGPGAEAGAGLRLDPGVAWLHAAGRLWGHLEHVLTDLHGSSNYKLITQQGNNNNATNVFTVYTD